MSRWSVSVIGASARSSPIKATCKLRTAAIEEEFRMVWQWSHHSCRGDVPRITGAGAIGDAEIPDLFSGPSLCACQIAVFCGFKFRYPIKNDVFKTRDHGRVAVPRLLEPLELLAQCCNLMAVAGTAMRAGSGITSHMLPQQLMVVYGDIRRSRCRLRSIRAIRTRKRHRDSRDAGRWVL